MLQPLALDIEMVIAKREKNRLINVIIEDNKLASTAVLEPPLSYESPVNLLKKIDFESDKLGPRRTRIVSQ